MNLSYLPAGEQDIPVIYQFSKELVERYEDTDKVDVGKVLPWMRRKIESGLAGYTCVLYDGVKAGYFALNTDGERAELDDLYVLPDFQNRGIGTEILKKCVDSTEKSIFLYVFKKNVGAIRLYTRMGFQKETDVSDTRCIMVHNG